MAACHKHSSINRFEYFLLLDHFHENGNKTLLSFSCFALTVFIACSIGFWFDYAGQKELAGSLRAECYISAPHLKAPEYSPTYVLSVSNPYTKQLNLSASWGWVSPGDEGTDKSRVKIGECLISNLGSQSIRNISMAVTIAWQTVENAGVPGVIRSGRIIASTEIKRPVFDLGVGADNANKFYIENDSNYWVTIYRPEQASVGNQQVLKFNHSAESLPAIVLPPISFGASLSSTPPPPPLPNTP